MSAALRSLRRPVPSPDPSVTGMVRVAVVGCAHGALDQLYASVAYLEQEKGVKIDLLLVCGDFQAVRNEDDLACMACPAKYRTMNTFYKYYSGECIAPVTTIFIGGNHEASNYLFELYGGGWVAPNIYFLGFAGVVNFGGLRIAGLSGIFKPAHFNCGYFETFPLDERSMRSLYHVREYEIYRLMQISGDLDVFMSHDWPAGIAGYGDTQGLLRRKPFFRGEIASNTLGNPETMGLLMKLRPSYWLSAHLHVKFAAVVDHDDGKMTRFLSLDKCLPHRDFMQVVDFPDKTGPLELAHDPEWLAIVKSSANLLSTSFRQPRLPPSASLLAKSETDINEIRSSFNDDMTIKPEAFAVSVDAYKGGPLRRGSPPGLRVNPQTAALYSRLSLEVPFSAKLTTNSMTINPEEITLDDGDSSEEQQSSIPQCTNPDEIMLDDDEEQEEDAE
ncbi:hypothetical protein PBRA_002668 [Plasmodiophora brassicae]|uniref:Lariat debranching enzyme C-terminal domain-containing protein n=1 Tax=Plasmodiophora brassicae TaxID=37360 RepID=A0A0G4J616_PLABS|nr:hypothetical protein PBRA_002668 [Plasmodiophora brassicae]